MPPLVAALISYKLAPLTGRFATQVGAVDLPGPRKVHQRPVPRLGGIAVITAVVSVMGVLLVRSSAEDWPNVHSVWPGLALGLLPILAISVLDDIKTLPAAPKFLAHALGASIAVWLGISLNPEVHLFGRTIAIGFLAF